MNKKPNKILYKCLAPSRVHHFASLCLETIEPYHLLIKQSFKRPVEAFQWQIPMLIQFYSLYPIISVSAYTAKFLM